MIKKLILLLLTAILLTGCLPSPITETKESKTEKNMITRSLVSTGNTYRINKKIKEAKKGEKTVIAYFGSSIFSEDKNEAAKQSFELIKQFIGKKADLIFENSGLYGSDSYLGNLFIKQITDKKPDIIFLDFAIFDSSEPECREAFEAMVRTCLESGNEPQVIIILNTKSDGSPKQDFMEQIAKYYNLPIINIASSFLPEFSSGRLTTDNIFSDNNSYTEKGVQEIAKFTENYIKTAYKEKKDKEYIVPQPMLAGSLNMQNTKLLKADEIQTDNFGSYLISKTNNQYFPSKIEYMTDTENSPIIFTLDANSINLIAPVSSSRQDIAEIYINGKIDSEINSFDSRETDFPKVFKIFSSDKNEKIAIGLKIKEKPIEEQNETTSEQQKDDPQEENTSTYKNFEFWGISYTRK